MTPDPEPGRLTHLLQRHRMGDDEAFDELVSIAYDQLRRVARGQLVRRGTPGTLSPTSLVHEVYVQLKDERGVDWQDRGHFFAIAAQVMRRVLVDAARARGAEKRGGQMVRATDASAAGFDFDAIAAPASDRAHELCALDDALTSLARLDPRRAQVIELRFFGGLTVDETAEVLHVSAQTVMRDWKTARTWLARELRWT